MKNKEEAKHKKWINNFQKQRIALVTTGKLKATYCNTDSQSDLYVWNKLRPVAIIESQLLLSNTLNLLVTLLAMNERHATTVTQVKCSHFLELFALKKEKKFWILTHISSQNSRLLYFTEENRNVFKQIRCYKKSHFFSMKIFSTLKNPASGPHLSYTLLDLPIAMIMPCILGVIMICHRDWK